MADSHPEGVVETGAQMDYEEHERSYVLFVNLSKYILLLCAALLIAMAFGFFTTAGFFSAFVLFVIISAVGVWLLR
jgi:hypothetical protein